MKIILKSAVASLGTVGDTVTVAGGYARNFLIPKGFAVQATKGNLKQFEAEKESLLKKAEEVKGGADTLKGTLEGLTLEFTRKAGEEDKLFGSVTSMDIAAALKEKGHEIDKRNILLDEPLKSLGETGVEVKLHPEIIATVKAVISKEE